ncbi:ATP-dependent DNA helicase pif1-like [Clytia hemisphaerica]|uniref:ATP-dependent DNA helicase pif1-like n=1 Tax=Clytia hemisphaerica TaxID=252671 RepID=UPI0034D65E15
MHEEEPNVQENRQAADRIRLLLNPQQTNISDTVLNSLAVNDIGTSKVFFLDGPGGTEKTFTYNYIIKEARARSFCVATSSWTGIAATLLDGDKTCHNLFKLPVPVNDGCSCNVKPTSKHADFLRSQHIFIFDEASMISKYALEAIDRMLRDISNSDVAFAGKVLLLGGDFRQTLPVVKRGTAAQVVEACITISYIWALVRTFYLHTNMRTGPGEQEFSEFLLCLGAGAPVKPDDPLKGCIQIPDECVLPENSDLVPHIFNFQNDNDPSTKVILTPTNDEALEINEKILRCLGGDVRTYFSFDSVMADTQEEVDLYPPEEFFHSLTPSGMPKHRLSVKAGSIIMLLRNL